MTRLESFARAWSPGPAIVIAAVALLTAGLLWGCVARSSSDGVGDPVADAVVPVAPDRSAPLAAVGAYLDWTSFAYRMANSDLASITATPYENVRIDSYIQLNREKGQGLEQALSSFSPAEASRGASSALIRASETWRYRYFSLGTRRYLTPWYTASYEATYSVVATGGVWLVDSVEATALTPVK